MNIKQTFLDFTSETYPYGYEQELFHLLPQNMSTDEFGNLFLQIGESPSTMFTSHLDTASSTKSKVNHVFDGNIIRTDGTSILGADDKAGVTIMIYLIENKIPGLYYFFLGEERGCIGSKKVAEAHRKSPLPNIKKVISFDRRGTDSIITFQSSQRCCSENFATVLAQELNGKSKKENTINLQFEYVNDPTGIYTDSYQFISVYPECTNISVGYMAEHTNRESQDILFLEKLCKTAILVDWETLPVERNPQEEDFDDPYTNRYRYNWNWKKFDQVKEENKTKKIWFIDNEFGKHISYVEVDSKYKVQSVDFSSQRLESEEKNIKDTLKSFEIDFKYLQWDGTELEVTYSDIQKSNHTRDELEQYIPELNFWNQYIK